MANPLPIEDMSVEEKLQAMELLWEDLCNNAGSVSSPNWHEDILEQRQATIEAGSDRFEDWETAKKDIKKRVS